MVESVRLSFRQTTIALVSKKKLNFGDRDKYNWEDAFNRISVDGLQKQVEELSRSWGNAEIGKQIRRWFMSDKFLRKVKIVIF